MTYIGDVPENTKIVWEWNTNAVAGGSITRATDGILYAIRKTDLQEATGVTVTKANPGVVTSTGHGLSNGDEVLFYDMAEMTELNQTIKTISSVTTNTFEIDDTSSHGTAETTGGKYVQVNTADITDREDVRGITGQHETTISQSLDDYFSNNSDWLLCMLGGVIDGQTVNSVIFGWSVENRVMRGTDGANTTTPPSSTAIRDAITGGAYALDTDANGRIRLVSGTGAGEVGVAGGLVTSNVQQWLGTTLATPDTSGYPKVTIKEGSGTGELNITNGSVDASVAGTVLASGTIGSTGNDATHVHLDGLGFADDDINDYQLVLHDDSSGLTYATTISDWVASTDLATVPTLPFTLEDGVDTYWLLPPAGSSGGDATLANQTTILSRLGTPTDLGGGATLADNASDMAGATFDTSTDSQEAIRNRGDVAWTTGGGGGTNPEVLQTTTIAALTDQTTFTLTAGSADNDAYEGCVAIITDQSTSTQKAFEVVQSYTGGTKGVVLKGDPGIFTMAVGDTIDIIAPSYVRQAQVSKPPYQGDYPADATIVVHLFTKDGSGVATDPTGGFGPGDIKIYKVGDVSAKSTDAGISATTGIQIGMIRLDIDTSDTADEPGWAWETGKDYAIVVDPSSEKVDGYRPDDIIATFSIENRTSTSIASSSVAAAVWNALCASYDTDNTFGAKVADILAYLGGGFNLKSLHSFIVELQTALRATAWTGINGDDIVGLLESMMSIAATVPAGASNTGTYTPATDSLEAIGTAAGSIAGTGSEVVTLQMLDTSLNELQDVEVYITTDQAGTNVVAGTKETDANGYVVFQLDTGTYYRWAQRNGYNFTNPQQFTITDSVVTATFSDATVATASTSVTLGAINELLEAIGEPHATSLDTGGTSDAAEAETILTRTTKEILERGPGILGGWCANTVLDKTYSPNTANQIEIPATIIAMERATGGDKYIYRNGLLYDPKDETFTFTDDVDLNVVELVDFEKLSPKLRKYITAEAARTFQRWKKRGQFDEALIQQRIDVTRAEAMQEDEDLSNRSNDTSERINRLRGNRIRRIGPR